VLVLYVGGVLNCAGSPGVFVLYYVGGELEMSGVGAFLKLGETCLAKRGASFTGQT